MSNLFNKISWDSPYREENLETVRLGSRYLDPKEEMKQQEVIKAAKAKAPEPLTLKEIADIINK